MRVIDVLKGGGFEEHKHPRGRGGKFAPGGGGKVHSKATGAGGKSIKGTIFRLNRAAKRADFLAQRRDNEHTTRRAGNLYSKLLGRLGPRSKDRSWVRQQISRYTRRQDEHRLTRLYGARRAKEYFSSSNPRQ